MPMERVDRPGERQEATGGKKMLSGNLAGGRQREGNCCIPWIGGDAPQKSQDIDLSTCLIPTP